MSRPKDERVIYLDHAATTPLDPDAFEAMEPFLRYDFGNPSSIHGLGQRARMAMDEARERVAAAIGAKPAEIMFTGSGTEADNSAIRGVLAGSTGGHIVTTAIEHEAVLETCRGLERTGTSVDYIAPADNGIVRNDDILAAITNETALVSVMHANNEIGTIQPIAEIGAACRERGVPLHVDAVQSVGAIPVDVNELNVDLLSLSAHKFHGPKGVGALYIRDGTRFRAQQLGGGQERTRRSGTENVAGIVGMSVALEKTVQGQTEAAARMAAMRDFLFDALGGDGISNGSQDQRLPGNVNISFRGISGEALVMALDQEGVMASSGSACASGSTEPSHVLLALGSPPEVAGGALRLTVGSENTWEEISAAVEIIQRTLTRLRQSTAAAAV